jgi:flagellar hook-associated protein 2
MTTAGSISSSTTGSTLDVPTLVSQLMTVARQPIVALNTKTTSYQAQISELGTLKSKMAAFQSAAQALGSSSSSSLLAATATSSDTAALSATADSTSVAGTYTLNVTKLAQAQSLVAVGQASSTATIGDGTSTTITFDFGTTGSTFVSNGSGTKTITIDSSNNTLQGIRDAINAAGIGVTASIVNDGNAATPYRLVLTSSSGASNSMNITTDGANSSIDNLLAYDHSVGGTMSLTQTVVPQNAAFDVNGISITKSSNTVTDAIPGVTLTLSNPTTQATTLTVARNTGAVSSAVASFVLAYNDLYSSMKTDSAWGTASTSTSTSTSTTTTPPVLAGDLTLRSLQTQMRDIASTAASGGTYSYLFDAGVSFKTDGTMQLDSAKLNSAMSTNFSDVANLFNSSTGFGTRFNQFATSALTVDGSFATHTADINSKISDINNQVATLETRMTALQTQYTAQYSALDMLLTSMNSTSNYLTSQFNAMASTK